MWRNLALRSWVPLLLLGSAPAMSAGPDLNWGMGSENQWSGSAPRSPILLRPASPPAAPRYLSQAQSPPSQSPTNSAAGDTTPSAVPEAAVKAEMEKRWGDAERVYRDLLAKEPDRTDLLLRLVDVLAVQNKRVEAAQTMARAADLLPKDGDLQLHASQAFGAADQPADALRYNDRALAIRPTDQALQRRRAQLATWAGDNAQAVESLRILIDANPTELALKRDLGRVLGWQGHPDEAANLLSEYVAQHPADKDALLDLARAQAARGDSDAAADLLKRYRDAGGDELTYRRELSEMLANPVAPLRAESEKRWGDAERLYRDLLAKEPNRIDLWLRLVDVLAVQNKQAEAAQTMAQAADQRPDDSALQLRASEAFGSADRLADALRYNDRALALRPTDQALQRRGAELYTWAGKYAEAEKTLRTLSDSDPTDPTLKRDLGRVLGWQGRTDEAVKLLSDYVAQRPEDQDALQDLERMKSARGKPAAAVGPLKRDRSAAGGAAADRRERARRLAPAGATTPPNVPESVIKAEMAKRWGEAERLLRGLIAREPKRVDLLLRLVDDLAVQKKRVGAAETLALAADLRPKDGALQLRASEAFGAADRPADALRYVNRALALRPTDMALHRRRAQVATWAGDNAQAEESLRILIDANPAELTLKRDLGRVVGWQSRPDEAVTLLSDYVAHHPEDKDALLDLARNQAGRGNSHAAIELLKRYREIGGDELTYHRELSLMLAWGGRLRSALALAEPGLAKDPADFQLHFARAVALQGGYQYGAALSEVDRLTQLRPNAPEIGDLRRSIKVQQRPYLQLDADARWESTQVAARGGEISYHQPINDVWWVFAGGGADSLSALAGGGFAPIQGGSTMARGSGWVGAQARLDYGTTASARVGATGSGRGSAQATWQITADSRLSDEFRVQLLNTRDFQIVSPRSLSLGITRIDTEAQLTYTPDLLWTVAATGREGEFSDGNHFLRGYVAPRRAIIRSQYWNVDLGVSGSWSGYSIKPPLNGYYSPSFNQQYATNTYIYYKMNQEDGISLVVSLGAQKDETFRNFNLSAGLYTEATFGQLSDWMWKIRAGYTNNGSAIGPNFSAESVGLTMVRRF